MDNDALSQLKHRYAMLGSLGGPDIDAAKAVAADAIQLLESRTPPPGAAVERADTSDLPDWNSPQMDEWQSAICWTTERLAELLGVTEYDADAGSETVDGDTKAILWNVLRAAGLINEETGKPIAAPPVAPSGDARDAARYRWLRNADPIAMREYLSTRPFDLDAAIDAAVRGKP